MISYESPSKGRKGTKWSSRRTATIRAHSLNHKMLTTSTNRFSNNPRTSLNMKTLQCNLDKPDKFMYFKGLYSCMKTKNPPLPVENDYSDNSI